MQMQLSCLLCQCDYSCDKIPRLLTHCGHTFCESCIETMVTESEDGQYKLVCPEDSKPIVIPSDDLKHFPKNIALMRMIDRKALDLEVSKIAKGGYEECDQDTQQLLQDIKGINQKEEKSTKYLNNIKDESDFDISKEAAKSNSMYGQTGHKSMPRVGSSGNLQQITPPERSQSSNSQQNQNVCLLHQKTLDVLCMEDMELICASCAIFGRHHNHSFRSVEQIQKQIIAYTQNVTSIVETKQSAVSSICNDGVKKQFLSILASKRTKLCKQVTEYFKYLGQKMRRAEEIALVRIEEAMQKAQLKVKKILQLDDNFIHQFNRWEETTQNQMKILRQGPLEDRLKLFYREATLHLQEGNNIVQKLIKKEQNLVGDVETILQKVFLRCDEGIADKIDFIVTVGCQEKSDRFTHVESTINNRDQFLLLQEEQKKLDQEENNIERIKQKRVQFTSVGAIHDYEKGSSTLTNTFSTKNIISATTNNLNQQSSILTRNKSIEKVYTEETICDARPLKKKLKSLRLPQKISLMLEQLYTLQSLDLTNAQLGQAVIIELCEFIKKSKVRTLKLIRNKLTDEVLPKIVPTFKNIVNLNLSQNAFTENCLNYLINSRQMVPMLKNLVLSQNKIVERKCRNMFERFRRMDITLSI